MPYSRMVGQESVKRALELSYIAPAIGGVLLSGERGTGKSTLVRAFCQMLWKGRVPAGEELPVTIPINATEDRVVGGWDVNALVQSRAEWKTGLLEEANGRVLYVDEINLLDDHIVNLILDVTGTGVLVIQREGQASKQRVAFTLVGTMNPEEGGLRPQLLDRFGLTVAVGSLAGGAERTSILANVIEFDSALRHWHETQKESPWLTQARQEDEARKVLVMRARDEFDHVTISDEVIEVIVKLATVFQVEGHRADYTLALAARANAAREGRKTVTAADLRNVGPLALQHRRPEALQSDRIPWGKVEADKLDQVLATM